MQVAAQALLRSAGFSHERRTRSTRLTLGLTGGCHSRVSNSFAGFTISDFDLLRNKNAIGTYLNQRTTWETGDRGSAVIGEQFHQKSTTSFALDSVDRRIEMSREIDFIMSRRPKTRKLEAFNTDTTVHLTLKYRYFTYYLFRLPWALSPRPIGPLVH